jgi:hypothetical protein
MPRKSPAAPASRSQPERPHLGADPLPWRHLRNRTDQAVIRARGRCRPIGLRDLLDRLLRFRAGNGQNTIPVPGVGSGILKTWKPASARITACAPPRTCTT